MAQESRPIAASSADQSVPFPQNSTARSDPVRAEAVDRATTTLDAWSFLVGPALFFFSAVLLVLKLGEHPSFAYNWESYTSWRFFNWWDHPATSIFDVNDGLMTDAASSPVLAPLLWISFKTLGVGLVALRLPGALLAAFAVPLTWVVGRRLCSSRIGLLAAVLLAMLPAFLLYARTATNVGFSVVPELITIYFLTRALQEPRRWYWLLLVQVMLLLNVYFYSPIRMLWPISFCLFAVEILFHRGDRWRLAVAFLVTVVVLPAAFLFVDNSPNHNPKTAVKDYYNARGETAISWGGDPENFKYYLKPTPEEQAAGHLIGSERQLVWRLVEQNGRNLINLMLDRGTHRAFIEFWNPHGRLYFTFLVPFFLLGLAKSVTGAFRRVEDRVLQACFWGFSLPLLLTSNVHIGRLVYVFPILVILVASGFFTIIDFALEHFRFGQIRHAPAVITGIALALVLVATARASWGDYHDLPITPPAVPIVAQLAADAGKIQTSGGDAVLVRAPGSLEVEQIDVSTYRLLLDDTYRFVDINSDPVEETADPGKPVLLYGQVIALIDDTDGIPSYCANTYYVEKGALAKFMDLTKPAMSNCGRPLNVVELAT